MRLAFITAALFLVVAAGCSTGTGSTDTSAGGSETPAASTDASTTGDAGMTGDTDTMTDTAAAGDTGAADTTDTMTDTAAAGATDTMTDTATAGDTSAAGATDTMTDTAAAGDIGAAGATDTMTDTAAAGDAASSAAGGATAHAEMMTADGTVVGMAHFTETQDGGVLVQVDLQGVAGAAAGEHGIHVHMVGACDPPDFMSAGEHHNPTAMQHGLENPNGPHAGDLPNLTMDDGGSAAYVGASTAFTLSEGPNTALDADGSALIIHANPDDQVTDPSGNSGARLVCGVLMADTTAQ